MKYKAALKFTHAESEPAAYRGNGEAQRGKESALLVADYFAGPLESGFITGEKRPGFR